MPIDKATDFYTNPGQIAVDTIMNKEELINQKAHDQIKKIEELQQKQIKLDHLRGKLPIQDFNEKQVEIGEDIIQIIEDLKEEGIDLSPFQDDVNYLHSVIEHHNNLLSHEIDRSHTEVRHLLNECTQVIEIAHFIIKLCNDLINKINNRATGR